MEEFVSYYSINRKVEHEKAGRDQSEPQSIRNWVPSWRNRGGEYLELNRRKDKGSSINYVTRNIVYGRPLGFPAFTSSISARTNRRTPSRGHPRRGLTHEDNRFETLGSGGHRRVWKWRTPEMCGIP